jgi:hypothetical protein
VSKIRNATSKTKQMAKKNDVDIRKILQSPMGILIAVASVVVLLFMLYLISRSGNTAEEAPIKEGQIMIQKGDEIITINESGLVEYKSKDKVYYETWDNNKVSSFFSMIQQKARESLDKPQPENCEYKIYLFLDGKLVSFCSDDEEIAEVVEELSDRYSGDDLGDFFDDDEEGGDEDEEFDGTIVFPTLTPTISIASPTPTPTSSPSGGDQTNYPPVEAGCDTWSGDIVGGRAVITNTYCTVESTPTPAP